MKRLVALFAVTSVALSGAWWFRADLVRFAYLGPPLLRVVEGPDHAERPVGSLDLVVEFAGGERVAVETFQCLLNGQDVTESLTVGRNGAVGAIVGLREGDNRIRLRVFGRSLWTGAFVDDEREFVVRVRGVPFLDLA